MGSRHTKSPENKMLKKYALDEKGSSKRSKLRVLWSQSVVQIQDSGKYRRQTILKKFMFYSIALLSKLDVIPPHLIGGQGPPQNLRGQASAGIHGFSRSRYNTDIGNGTTVQHRHR